jgi:hypothetical protein
MAKIGLGFQLTASATQMSRGINAGVVELQKLGYAAKRTAADVSTLKNIELTRLFIGSIRAVTSAIGQANSLLTGFVNESVSIGEEASKANVLFGDAALAIQEFATSSSDIGLSSRAALQASASFGNLFTAIGLGQEQAADYSVTLTRLAADLASFNNTTTEEAVVALGAALRGESEPIRRYGVLLSDATLRQTALANGFRVTAGALDPAVRAQAAFLAILQQTSSAQGDFTRTSESLANQQRILAAEWDNVRAAIGEGLQPAYRSIVQALRDSLPAIEQAGRQIAVFIKQIDFGAVVGGAVDAVRSLANVFGVVIQVATPLAGNLLPAIGGYLAFINRQAIASGIVGLANTFSKAATALTFYGSAARAAAAGSAILAASIRSLLISTGIGAVAVVIGLAAGALLDWALAGRAAGSDVVAAVDDGTEAARQFQRQMQQATAAATDFGDKVTAVLKVPGEITINEFAQGSLNEARSSIVALAKELGGLDQVPQQVLDSFREISQFAGQITNKSNAQSQALGIVKAESDALLESVRAITEARKAEAEATKAAADAARRAAEQASQDAQRRVQSLAESGLTTSEQSRITLAQDLLAVQRTIADAESALAAARQAGDASAIRQAQERLRLTQQTAGAARQQAIDQDRQRRLAALGIDEALLRPAQTLEDQLRNVARAFRQDLLGPEQARAAVQNLAADGVRIRQELAAELARPSQQALQAADIRTQEGASQLLALATGREDPAIEQRRQQLNKLDEIRRALVAVGIQPVDILGG